MSITKACTRCRQDLPYEAFAIDRANKSTGRRSLCRICTVAPVLTPAEKACAVCKIIMPVRDDTFAVRKNGSVYSYCRACARGKVKARWNGLPIEEKRKTYIDNESAKLKQRGILARIKADPVKAEKHKKRVDAYRKVWKKKDYAKNRERYIAEANAARAKRLLAPGEVTNLDILTQFRSQSGKCLYCGDVVGKSPRKLWHVDHFVPLSRGGDNTPQNIRIACADCNLRKHNKMPWEWMPDRFSPPGQQAAD